jgi:hypothetical protein
MTDAPGTAEPDESTTRPDSEPAEVCAKAALGSAASASRARPLPNAVGIFI